MCGIVGFIDADKKLGIVQEMLATQSYRGPDDSGTYFDEESGIHFGHNRLSIQDLTSQGHQPFISDCENYVIAFNGEVYNFRELRIELERLGHQFHSQTDSEVVLNAWVEWGEECVHHFNGMFAFSVWDKQKKTLFLVRDRYGIKPL